MARQRVHSHPCQGCQKPVECGGDWEANVDGCPEVICREFHEPNGGLNFDFRCDDCDRDYWSNAGSYAEL